MIFVIIGAVGFIILFFFDLAALKKIRFLKTVIWIVGNCLIIFSLNMITLKGARFDFPRYVKHIGIVISIVSSLLLIYSVLIEIPFKRTYLEKGTGNKLITTGTYGLIRHPGVLWFIMLLIGFFLLSGSKYLAIAIPAWGFMDILYVVVQDKYYFPEQFGEEYQKYKEQIPMFIPTRKSLRRCIITIGRKDR